MRPEIKSALFVLILVAVALPGLATEATSGTLPWNEPLETIMDNITGPTARALSLIGVAVFLIVWAVSSDNRALFGAAKAILVLSVIVGLTSFLGNLGIEGALI